MSKCDTCVNKPTEMTHCHLCLIREILTLKAENEKPRNLLWECWNWFNEHTGTGTLKMFDKLEQALKKGKYGEYRQEADKFIAIFNSQIKQLQKENVKLIGLLSMAKCPCCDGSGGFYDSYGNACQCQWCHEREQTLKGDK